MKKIDKQKSNNTLMKFAGILDVKIADEMFAAIKNNRRNKKSFVNFESGIKTVKIKK